MIQWDSYSSEVIDVVVSQFKAVARTGSLGSKETPQTKKGPPKGPLECKKRFTKGPLLMLHNYTDIDLEDLPMANQLGHACSKITIIIQRKVHFSYTKNLHAEMPGYGLAVVSSVSVCIYTDFDCMP